MERSIAWHPAVTHLENSMAHSRKPWGKGVLQFGTTSSSVQCSTAQLLDCSTAPTAHQQQTPLSRERSRFLTSLTQPLRKRRRGDIPQHHQHSRRPSVHTSANHQSLVVMVSRPQNATVTDDPEPSYQLPERVVSLFSLNADVLLWCTTTVQECSSSTREPVPPNDPMPHGYSHQEAWGTLGPRPIACVRASYIPFLLMTALEAAILLAPSSGWAAWAGPFLRPRRFTTSVPPALLSFAVIPVKPWV